MNKDKSRNSIVWANSEILGIHATPRIKGFRRIRGNNTFSVILGILKSQGIQGILGIQGLLGIQRIKVNQKSQQFQEAQRIQGIQKLQTNLGI